MSGEMESVRRYYGVPARRGARVRFTWGMHGFEGTILSAKDHKLYLRDDRDGRRRGPFHPTWEMEYLDAS